MKSKTEEILKALERKSRYENYVQSLISRKKNNEDQDDEFSRQGYIIEDTLDVLKSRLRLFYSNFTEDFKQFENEFKRSYKRVMKFYVNSKISFERVEAGDLYLG